jgi:hypothetical protein
MQALYVLHPNALLKTWVLLLRLQEPEFYGKVWAPSGSLPFRLFHLQDYKFFTCKDMSVRMLHMKNKQLRNYL